MYRHVKRTEFTHQHLHAINPSKRWDVFVLNQPANMVDWRAVKDWCDETFEGREYTFAVSLVLIQDEADAFAFKMRWV